MKLESYDKLHIEVTVHQSSAPGRAWRFTSFYGEARHDLRDRSWDLLKLLNSSNNLPWLCAGDFNEVLHASEKIGGQGRSESQMEGFCEEVEYCGFSDLGYIGLLYMWDNRQPDSTNVKCRLDKGLANSKFLNLFQSARV